nr:MAG TPA: hypothetical protein [Caudoviricetes sp.]
MLIMQNPDQYFRRSNFVILAISRIQSLGIPI